MNQSYYTLDNGGYPFKVDIHSKNAKYKVEIYKRDPRNDEFNNNNNNLEPEYKNRSYTEYATSPIKVKKIFIGKSPRIEMTKASESYGKEFDGNSILLQKTEKTYIFVGDKIFSFRPLSEIVKFVSPVGNSQVPYPYAVDIENNYYMLIADVVMKNPKISKSKDPYDVYYRISYITKNVRGLDPLIEFENIDEFYIDNHMYALNYKSHPDKDYDRSAEDGTFYIKKTDGKKYILTKNGYINLIKRFGKKVNLYPINNLKILYQFIY
jgi:hypothetical protein